MTDPPVRSMMGLPAFSPDLLTPLAVVPVVVLAGL